VKSTVGESYRNGLSRRDFLKLGGAGLAGAALLGVAGCGGGGSSSGELTFTFWGSTFEKKAIDEMVQSFEEAHPDIKVDAQHIPENYETKINTLIAAKNPPDVAYLGAGMAMRLAEEGKLVNVEKYFDEYPQLTQRLPQTYYYWAPGKTIGTSTAVEIMDLWYNKDLFDEAGVDYPPADAAEAWTWDEFVQTAMELTLDESGTRASEEGFDPENVRQFGVSVPTWYGGWLPFFFSNGGSFTNEDGTRYTLNSPEGVEVFQRLQDLIYEHRVAPSPSQQEQQAATTTVQLQTKRVAMAIDGQWNLLDMSQSNLNYGIAVLPKFQEPKTIVLGAPTVIFKNTEYPEKALEFYLYHNDPTAVELYSNGLWMPLEEKYYTEEKFIKQWTDNEAHPPEYREAVIDYTLNYSEPDLLYRIKNWDAIDPKLTAGLDLIWTNKKPAREALDDLEGTIQPLLKGLYPSIDER
jgi:multiple sugar transport system substrate-binding protein